jgi:pimeloyl-ACP methyl ester carboxylesterase
MAISEPTYISPGSGAGSAAVGGDFLFAALDRPDPGVALATPILVCAPWGWAETASYRGRREWGRSLADAGHPVLRFDLPSVGDSAGSPRDPGMVEAWVGAIDVAARWLRARYPGAPSIAALGLGLGGLLALEAIAAGAPLDEVALWGTPATGSSFARETRAFSRMQIWHGEDLGGAPLPDGWLEAGGFVLSAATAAELKGLDPLKNPVPPTLRRALLLGRDGAKPNEPLRARLEGGGVDVTAGQGPGWEQLTSHPAYSWASDEVMERVARWLAEGEAGDPGRRDGASTFAAGPVEFEWGGEEIRESLFSFPIDAGAGRGVVAEPVGKPTGETTGVFLNAAAIRHIGPNRLWVDAGRDLAGRGSRSVRVDFEGVGESDGDAARFREEAEFFATDQSAQVGAVLDRLETEGMGGRFLLVGLCSGAYWAFQAALEDPRVDRALLLNPGAFHWRPTMLMERQGHGFSILARRDLWRRVGRGEISVRKLAAITKYLVGRVRARISERLPGSRQDAQAAKNRTRDAELEKDFDLLQATGKQVTIAFTDNEALLRESKRHSTLDEIERWPNLRLVTLPGIDHALAPIAAQRFARDLIVAEFEQLVEAQPVA